MVERWFNVSMQQNELEIIHKKIFRYSLRVAGNRWEAEDLAQEAFLKFWKALECEPFRSVTNAYLYRIVQNAWKDKLRKNNTTPRPVEQSDEQVFNDKQLATREMLEVLAQRLSPKAMAILLLIDVFDFTAKEAAKFLASSEGSVQVTLGRARARLKRLANESQASKSNIKQQENWLEGQIHFDKLVDAFRRHDVKALCQSFVGIAGTGFEVKHIYWQEGTFYFFLRDPDGHLFLVTS
jgi:RNA polymerase sigma factor (sigma-70 family)